MQIGYLRDWWTETSARNFEERDGRTKYNNFELKEVGMRVNGTLTLGENIGDNGGIKEAFRAYKAFLARNGREKMVPGFDFTNEQLFYIGYGNIWCSKRRPESLRTQIMTDEHAPSRARWVEVKQSGEVSIFRVNGVVANQPEFAEAFNCPAGSPMNPVKKSVVW